MILKPSEINLSKITHARDALLEVISSSLYLKITVFEDQFSRLLNLYYLYLHQCVAILKHSYF